MIDRYTKIVLTIIAAALVAIVAQNGLLPAMAQSNVAYSDACGTVTHPPCKVQWDSAMPVTVQNR